MLVYFISASVADGFVFGDNAGDCLRYSRRSQYVKYAVSASQEGILVSDKNQSSYIKPFVDKLDQKIMFAEKSWGNYRVLDVNEDSMTIKVSLKQRSKMNYHSHQYRDEVWTVISGKGIAVINGKKTEISPGDVVKMPAGCKHMVEAITALEMIEVQCGRDISVTDKVKFDCEV